MWADMREGALFIWDRRPMLWLIGTFTAVNFLTVPVIMLQPMLVKYNLHAGVSFETALATVSSVSSIGGVLGGVAAGAVGGLLDPGVIVVVMSLTLAGFCVVQLFNPYLKRVEEKEWLDRLAAEANARRRQA